MLNPLEVFVAAYCTPHLEGQCKSTNGALTSVISLLNNNNFGTLFQYFQRCWLDTETQLLINV